MKVVDLEAGGFTAARARNAGYRRLREMRPDLTFILFVDGDCDVESEWPAHAVAFLKAHADVGAVAGRRRERYPERSVYNWLCDREWDTACGETRAVGGDSVMRMAAINSVGGFRDDLIAGEEPELCVRMRAKGWRIWRLDQPMTIHDAAMTRFAQWWRRSVRAGYAFAQGAHLHGRGPDRHWLWESRRAWIWGVALPVACILCGYIFFPWGFALMLIYPLQVARQYFGNTGSTRDRAAIAFFQTLARFPEAVGQIKFLYDRIVHRPSALIEYK
ncbi:MAG: glycosyltransferase family 2 protein [Hyphomicrobium sp.]|uniref:glycosyltransferase n=1 Tax=Hyphomicrobium sp. TaxID=82 RepID=UPI0039E56534